MMFASSKGSGEKETELGIIQGHAYALVNLWKLKDNKNTEVWLVELRNPWGKGEWKGKWKDRETKEEESTESWDTLKMVEMTVNGTFYEDVELKDEKTGQMKRLLHMDASNENVKDWNDGLFFMEFSDYLKQFERTSIAYVNKESKKTLDEYDKMQEKLNDKLKKAISTVQTPKKKDQEETKEKWVDA